LSDFIPLFRNPHLATVAGNFWTRPKVDERWPRRDVFYETEPQVKVLVHEQQPEGAARGEVVLVHGLEGSSEAGYARSMAWAALSSGFAVYRFHMRACGGTDDLAPTAYHAGQTCDLLAFLRTRKSPVFLVGFSLGGNVVLKLAGELEQEASRLIRGVCSVSTPIDLAACAQALGRPENFLYERRFLTRMKERIRRRHVRFPEVYSLDYLPRVRTIIDFDEFYTSKLFGFGTAANYFKTQSANGFLGRIRVPGLLIAAQDDPLVPFGVYDTDGLHKNPNLRLIAPEHGGHLGFLSRHRPRFWVDETVVRWVQSLT
jgi:predicted alpha/beta-fold hydrolase